MALEKEDIMALIAILQKGLEDDVSNNTETQNTKQTKKRTSTKNKPPKQKLSKNKFDSMSERHMHKKDTLIDKKLWNNLSLTDRTRKYTPIEVKCRSCGKTEKVNPVLIESVERYKCNRCAASPG
jgi:hypothetical protein